MTLVFFCILSMQWCTLNERWTEIVGTTTKEKVWIFLFVFCHVSFFSLSRLEIFEFPVMEVYQSDCKAIVGARRSTEMSIPGELGPSIFRRNMEGMRLMGEEMDGKLFISRQKSTFQPLMLFRPRVTFSILILTWRANNYVSRQRRGKNRRNESTKT